MDLIFLVTKWVEYKAIKAAPDSIVSETVQMHVFLVKHQPFHNKLFMTVRSRTEN